MRNKTVVNLISVLLAVLIIAVFVDEQILADDDVNNTVAEYEGFLVGVEENRKSEDTAELFGDHRVEKISNNVYWAVSLGDLLRISKSIGPVTYIEPNYYAELMAEPDEPETESHGWPFEVLNMEFAKEKDLEGEGIRIAVIDSGVDLNNVDLQEASIAEGYDYINETSEMTDSVYHGTKIAQIISGDNNSLGLSGIAPKAEIIPLRCFSATGGGTVKMLSQAIYDAVDTYHCDIINMSWGLKSNSKTLSGAIEYAYEQGVIMVASAGNVSSSYPQGTTMYPAYYEEVISVSAVDNQLNVLSLSQQNDGVNVCAPGGEIPFLDRNANVEIDSGTSYSAPCVAAIIALLLGTVPEMNKETISDLLNSRSLDLGDENYDIAYGSGLPRLDLLIGQKYSFLQMINEGNDSLWEVAGWIAEPEIKNLIIAGYNDSGQMKHYKWIINTEKITPFNDRIEQGGIPEISLFYVNEDFEAVSEKENFNY